VLRTGIQWKALPRKYGAASSIHQYFSEWAEAGFFLRMWQEGLTACDEMKGLGREWQSADGCMAKSTFGAGSGGEKPGGPEKKKGTKRSLAAESHGLPISVVLDGANRHDVKLLEDTLRSIVAARPEGAHLCLDAGYTGSQKTAEDLWYKAHIRGREEEREEKEHNPQYVARRRVAEACHSWLNRFRKLQVRYGKKSRNYRALAQFACAVIV
jgi:putative transposase